MDPKVVGSFIKELRKEKHLTQEQLALDLNVDRTTVVKWEKGNALPLNESLVLISNYFKITLDELLLGHRYEIEEKTEEDKEEIKTKGKNELILSLLKSDKKSKTIAKYFILITIIIFIIFLVYYFFTTYNSIHVYLLYGGNENFSTRDNLLIVSNEKVYLRMGNIEKTGKLDNLDVDKISIYEENGNEKVVVFTGDRNELLVEKQNNVELFKNTNIKNRYDNLYLVFNYEDEEITIKLDVKEDFRNKGLLFKDTVAGKNTIIETLSLKPNKEFVYNEENDTYSFIGKNFEIVYFQSDDVIRVYEVNKNNEIEYEYNNNVGYLNYTLFVKKKVVEMKSALISNIMTDSEKEIYTEFKEKYLDKYFNET